MIAELPLNSLTPPTKFLMVSSANNFRGAAGLSPLPEVWLSKNCGPFMPALGQVLEIGYGWYELLGHLQDRDTPGELTLHAEVANPAIQCVDPTYFVVNQGACPPSGLGAGWAPLWSVLNRLADNSDINTANLRLLAKYQVPSAYRGEVK